MNNIGSNVQIHETCKLGLNVTIGNNVTIYKNVTIEDNVSIFDNSVIGRQPKSVDANKRKIKALNKTIIKMGSVIGVNCVIYTGASIGKKNIIGDNVVIRENVDFKENVVIGYNSSIQYNVSIGESSRVLQQSAVSSYTKIGKNNFISCGFICVSDSSFGKEGYREDKVIGPKIKDNNNIGPHVTMISGLKIGSNNTIGAHSLVTKNIEDNGVYYGVPAKFVKKN